MGPGAGHRGARPEAPAPGTAPGGEEKGAVRTAAEPFDALAAASLRSLRCRQMRLRGVPSATREQGWYRPREGGKVRWGRNNGKSSSNPSRFFTVVSLPLAPSLHGYEGQRHRTCGTLAWRALDVDGPMVGHNDFTHNIELQTCPFRTRTI